MKKKGVYRVFFDGGEQIHPLGGFACYTGWIIKNDRGGIVASGQSLKQCNDLQGSCSVEMDALISSLRGLLTNIPPNFRKIHIHGDSQTVINFISGEGKPKKADLKTKLVTAFSLVKNLRDIDFSWIPRTLNSEADKLGRNAFKTTLRTQLHG